MNLYVTGAVYLLVVNAAAFAAFGRDKRKAEKGRWRIPERFLLMLALLGGSIGAWIGMKVFRHKIHKTKFKAAVLLILTIQCAGAFAVGKLLFW